MDMTPSFLCCSNLFLIFYLMSFVFFVNESNIWPLFPLTALESLYFRHNSTISHANIQRSLSTISTSYALFCLALECFRSNTNYRRGFRRPSIQKQPGWTVVLYIVWNVKF